MTPVLALVGLPDDVVSDSPGWLYELYASGMRASMFSGFLTLSGFLLSALTFIVINMKKEVYDTDFYRETYAVQKRLKPGMQFYGPLERLAHSLLWNVALSLLTSASQFSVGLIPSPFAAAVCMLLAAGTMAYLAVSICRLRRNLKDMFVWFEAAAAKKAAEASSKAATPPT